jgi:hypothetical protein
MSPKKLKSIRILVVGEKDFKYIFEDAAGIPPTSVSNDFISLTAKTELGERKEKGKKKYPILWLQKPLEGIGGREWFNRLKDFSPNALILFVEPETELSFYQAAMQENYIRILESLDLNETKADKLAKKLKILFLFALDNDSDPMKTKDYLVELHKLRLIYQEKFPAAAFREVMMNIKKPEHSEVIDLLEMVRQVFEDEF